MIQYYQVLKAKTGHCRFNTDNEVFTAYLFKDSIQEIDIEKTTDLELQKTVFNVPIIIDPDLFKSSGQKEGFALKPVRLDSIRKFQWLDSPNQP